MDTITILHVDDNPDFRQTFKFLLEKERRSVWSCGDPSEADQLVAERDFDALVVDSHGFAFAEAMKRCGKPMKIVALSNHPNNAEAFCDALIAKTDPDWLSKALIETNPYTHRRDIFAELSSRQLKEYRGKVFVVRQTSEDVVFVAESLPDAEDWVKESSYAKELCRFVQGPPTEDLTLEELEGR